MRAYRNTAERLSVLCLRSRKQTCTPYDASRVRPALVASASAITAAPREGAELVPAEIPGPRRPQVRIAAEVLNLGSSRVVARCTHARR